MRTRKKVVFIGGHHNSALAVVDWLLKNTDISVAWIGKKNISQSKSFSPEYIEVQKRNIPFYHLIAGKFFRTSSVRFVPKVIYNLLLIPVGIMKAFLYILRIKPDLIVSFGGYLAVPVVLSAWILRIPSVTHEQTTVIGLANKIVGKFVKKIYTAWPLDFYAVDDSKRQKMIFTGLPLRKDILDINSSEVESFKNHFEKNLPVIYLTGGKTGSLFLNRLMFESIEKVINKFNLVWQCGHRTGDYDYEQILAKLNGLTGATKRRVILKKYFLEGEIGLVFGAADLVISRGGAHTVYELYILEKPAILVPIPWSSNNEQMKNAMTLEKVGLGKVLHQEKLDSKKFVREIFTFWGSRKEVKKYNRVELVRNGQEKLGNEILEILNS